MNNEMYKQTRSQIRQTLIDGRSRHVVVERVIAWCLKHAAKSWDTAAIIQIKSIFRKQGITVEQAKALVMEMSIKGGIRISWDKSFDWDKGMLDIPTI